MNTKLFNNQSLPTNTTFLIPIKWHNVKRGLQTLAQLFYVAKKSQTLILVSKSSYISYFLYTSVIYGLGFDLRGRYRYYSFLYPEVLFLDLSKDDNDVELSDQMWEMSNYILREDEFLIFSKDYIYTTDSYEKLNQDIDIIKQYLRDYEYEPIKLIVSELIINARTSILTSKHFGKFYNENIMFAILITDRRISIVLFNRGISIKENIEIAMNIEYDHEYQYLEATLMRGFSTKDTDTGGLGLYTVDQLVKESCGKIEIVSGKGAMIRDYREIGLSTSFDLNYVIPFTSVFVELERSKIKSSSDQKKQLKIIDKLGG